MIKINMGCGKRNFGKDWVHIDAGDYDHLDYTSIQDLSKFSDDSVDLIYASHVIEYFDRESVIGVLEEWKRVLKPDGILRLAVPDFEMMCLLYTVGHSLETFLGPLYGRMEMGEQNIYHKTVYDQRSLTVMLSCLGFRNIRRYDWEETEHANFDDHSQAYIPHMDKTGGTLISLNLECVK
jgi:predicted SAM-dependent methyltransferase